MYHMQLLESDPHTRRDRAYNHSSDNYVKCMNVWNHDYKSETQWKVNCNHDVIDFISKWNFA